MSYNVGHNPIILFFYLKLYGQSNKLQYLKSGWRSKDADLDGNLAVLNRQPKLKRPPKYKVMLLNDDYTPMILLLRF